MRWTIEPVRAVSPDRQPNGRETPDRKHKDTFDNALQEAVEVENDRRQDRGRA